MSYGRWIGRVYPAEVAREARERERRFGPPKPYVPPPLPRVTRQGKLVRLVEGGRKAEHRYPNDYLAKRMEYSLRAHSDVRRRFFSVDEPKPGRGR